MKTALALVLICLSAPLSAGERCTASQAQRAEVARVLSAKPAVTRTVTVRPQKLRALLAWQRSLLFEQQIL